MKAKTNKSSVMSAALKCGGKVKKHKKGGKVEKKSVGGVTGIFSGKQKKEKKLQKKAEKGMFLGGLFGGDKEAGTVNAAGETMLFSTDDLSKKKMKDYQGMSFDEQSAFQKQQMQESPDELAAAEGEGAVLDAVGSIFGVDVGETVEGITAGIDTISSGETGRGIVEMISPALADAIWAKSIREEEQKIADKSLSQSAYASKKTFKDGGAVDPDPKTTSSKSTTAAVKDPLPRMSKKDYDKLLKDKSTVSPDPKKTVVDPLPRMSKKEYEAQKKKTVEKPVRKIATGGDEYSMFSEEKMTDQEIIKSTGALREQLESNEDWTRMESGQYDELTRLGNLPGGGLGRSDEGVPVTYWDRYENKKTGETRISSSVDKSVLDRYESGAKSTGVKGDKPYEEKRIYDPATGHITNVKYSDRPKYVGTPVDPNAVPSIAEGGKIKGTGTKKSDSISAKLPEGSYIIPADAPKSVTDRLMNYMNYDEADLNYDNGEPVKVSDGEYYIPAKDVMKADAFVKRLGYKEGLDEMAPNAETKLTDNRGYQEGGFIDKTSSFLTDYVGTLAGIGQLALSGFDALKSEEPESDTARQIRNLSNETRLRAEYGMNPYERTEAEKQIERSFATEREIVKNVGGGDANIIMNNIAAAAIRANNSRLALETTSSKMQEEKERYADSMTMEAIKASERDYERKYNKYIAEQEGIASTTHSGIANIIGQSQYNKQLDVYSEEKELDRKSRESMFPKTSEEKVAEHNTPTSTGVTPEKESSILKAVEQEKSYKEPYWNDLFKAKKSIANNDIPESTGIAPSKERSMLEIAEENEEPYWSNLFKQN